MPQALVSLGKLMHVFERIHKLSVFLEASFLVNKLYIFRNPYWNLFLSNVENKIYFNN